MAKKNSLQCPKCGSKAVSKGGQESSKDGKRGVQRYRCKPCKWNGTRPVGIEKIEAQGVDRKKAKALYAHVKRNYGRKRYVITSAQNATPVNRPFLDTMLGYCRHRGAQLIVIPYRYKNPTSMWSARAKGDDWWAPELKPFLLDYRTRLNSNLMLLGDIKTQPTASSPLDGFASISGSDSAIIGHPKIALNTIPTPQSRLPKILTTTGAVTVKNYIPGKAGKKGEHHHSFGATVAELNGKAFHLRQINAVRDGSFCDLDYEYRARERERAAIAALVMGDSHIKFIDPRVVQATFIGRNSMVRKLRPAQLVWHDAIDFYNRNHHHRGEPFINYAKHHFGHGNVERELDEGFAFIDAHTPPSVTNVFAPSNHPDALARWVKECDPRADPENAIFWAETFKVMCAKAEWTKTGAKTVDPFVYWAKKKLKCVDRCVFPSRDQSHMILGIDCGYHGDKGANGGKGTLKSFANIGVKTVTAHGHAPGIDGGAYRVGTSSYYALEYASGPSSWLHTHCAIYRNGKRSLLNTIDGEWFA